MLIQSETESKLDAEIQSALDKLAQLDKESEPYGAIVERVSKLHKLKTEEQLHRLKVEEHRHKVKIEERFKQISPDTVLIVVANIFGILWLTRYERENVISSKALGFVMKPR